MNVLVAGGAGYIGSHTVRILKEQGHSPVIYDNLSRGHRTVAEILKVPAVAADLNDKATLIATLREHRIETVMHFAAYAYVGESVEKPLLYYQNNVATTINVLQCMGEANVNRFVFSSTCAVYGDVEKMPITEDETKKPVSPYGRTKLMVEEILRTAEQVTGKKVPLVMGPRRAGDAVALYANPARAKQTLGWEAKHKDPKTIIQSAWNWFKDHPRGYR